MSNECREHIWETIWKILTVSRCVKKEKCAICHVTKLSGD
jgi:hypothetical protein